MNFDTDATHAGTTAAQAFASKSGVCQDFAHVFIAGCRLLGLPSRYVTGYLFMQGNELHADAHHAWAETAIADLGWVGFDPANGICPDARYVRLACAPDATYAGPFRGLRRGPGDETLTVAVSVSAAAQSSQ
jgi:transglutaminase-like putative cysteine protease